MRSLTSILMSVVLSVSAVLALSHYTPSNSFTQVRQATVALETEDGIVCSGVLIKPHVVLSAAHCDVGPLTIKGKKAVVIKKDIGADLLLLFADVEGTPLPLASGTPAVDERVVTVGYPMGIGQVVTEGRFQGFTMGYMLVTAPSIFGNSGGPVVVRRGLHYELVGVTSAIVVVPMGFSVVPITHLNLIVPTYTIHKFIK